MQRVLFIICIVWLPLSVSAQNEVCITTEEAELYKLINEYRKDKGLPPIPLSWSLTKVAQTHSKDLYENFNPDNANECNAHSWSKNGDWTPCCYTPDHKQSKCMWEKPRELAGYDSEGFEIAYYFPAGASPVTSLKGWQSSPAHNEVIINQGIWGDMTWGAIGIGIHKNYATVWFGVIKDEKGKPKNCQ